MTSTKEPLQSTDELINHAADLHKKNQQRVPYTAEVDLFLLSEDGKVRQPITVKTVDISQGGICIRSRNMFHVGEVGGIKLIRSDGAQLLVGVEVRHCRYIGEMLHNTGLQFIPLPDELSKRVAE